MMRNDDDVNRIPGASCTPKQLKSRSSSLFHPGGTVVPARKGLASSHGSAGRRYLAFLAKKLA